ncbi:D-serine ammonia-lyase [Bacillus sp. BRMEA1]|uniref:D-serine ammonia-lyase n=1 Tax=Neobacillus endophyticus TaxID=2738405 RepID=UPI001564F2E9|nr:D-serine ammonia-lyase [Neobacillus endophyticus]NRD79535.1 D-serine ammonia-lyase [Neobacillus endophyticus]
MTHFKIQSILKNCPHPLIDHLISLKEVFWLNQHLEKYEIGMKKTPFTIQDVQDAEARLGRFAAYIAKAFPETSADNGIIESPLTKISQMKQKIQLNSSQPLLGQWLLKCDSHLPISGSIKARGGIYEVLKHAEELAIGNQMLSLDDDYSIIASEKFREFFSQYTIAVGSTGNLGLSIGIISAKLGFNVTVHMSTDAKQWKKDLLRSKNVTVVEYTSDYSKAVAEGRRQAASDPDCYFIDDENSPDLFLGYAVAALRLQKQLNDQNIQVDENHPLFVYLPCGVGGGPGGVAFGLKLFFRDYVHCFFAEPVHSPCMLLGMMTGLHDQISVYDFGIDNITEADGLAVGRPSGFIGKLIEPFLSGIYTVSDKQLFIMLKNLADTENLHLEPSALAGMSGPVKLMEEGNKYLLNHQLAKKMKNSTHIIWATGGSMVPQEVLAQYYKKGKSLMH